MRIAFAAIVAVDLLFPLPVLAQAPPKFTPATEITPALMLYEKTRLGVWTGSRLLSDEQHDVIDQIEGDKRWHEKVLEEGIKPVGFDADYNMSVLKKAGIEYVIFNAKEGPGFCFWDSQHTDYDIGVLEKRLGDRENGVLAQVVRACRKHGLLVGLNYCYGPTDRYHKKRMTDDEYFQFAENQVRELVTWYRPSIMFFTGVGSGKYHGMTIDGQHHLPARRVQGAYNTVKSLDPDCLVTFHNRHDFKPEYPTDVFQPVWQLPPPSGHNAWMRHGSKSYYVPMETFAGLFGNESLEALAIVHMENVSRGGHTLFVWAGGLDNKGRYTQKTQEFLMKFREALDTLPPNMHSEASPERNPKQDLILASVEIKSNADPKGGSYSQRCAVARYKAVMAAEEVLLSKVETLATKTGKTVKQAMDDDPELREGVMAEVREAKVTQTEWLPEHGCKVTLGLQRFEVEKWVGDLQ